MAILLVTTGSDAMPDWDQYQRTDAAYRYCICYGTGLSVSVSLSVCAAVLWSRRPSTLPALSLHDDTSKWPPRPTPMSTGPHLGAAGQAQAAAHGRPVCQDPQGHDPLHGPGGWGEDGGSSVSLLCLLCVCVLLGEARMKALCSAVCDTNISPRPGNRPVESRPGP